MGSVRGDRLPLTRDKEREVGRARLLDVNMKRIGLILLTTNTALFIISLSLSLVILFRPFYYFHINYLNLEQYGYTYNEIKESYDDVMDYLVLNKEFKIGNLKYSESGKNHFHDCKILFMINFIVLFISSFIVILKRKYLKENNIFFFSSIIIISLFLILLITSLIIGFDKFFDLFHYIFFLGKDNWLLNPNEDEIINLLPKEYFCNCGILFLLITSIIPVINIIKYLYKKRS